MDDLSYGYKCIPIGIVGSNPTIYNDNDYS